MTKHVHVYTYLFQTCAELQDPVNVKGIVISLIDRLTSFAVKNELPSNIELFNTFSQEIAIIVQVSLFFFICLYIRYSSYF